MVAIQEILSFQTTPSYKRADFYTCTSNADAFRYATTPTLWSQTPIVYICGEEGSGKTHIAHIFQEAQNALNIQPITSNPHAIIETYDAFVWDDCDTITPAEEIRLFHWYNSIQERGGRLLLTGATPLGLLNIQLPDLASRLAKSWHVPLNPPTDALLEIILRKQLSDAQLRLDYGVIHYILKRADRSYSFIKKVVEALNTQSLLEKKTITIPQAAKVLDALKPAITPPPAS